MKLSDPALTLTLCSLPIWTILREPRFDGSSLFTRMCLEQGIAYRSEGSQLSRGELRDWVSVVNVNHIGLSHEDMGEQVAS